MTPDECSMAWCTSNHADELDNFDGYGSRFHWGNFVEHELSPVLDTWEREDSYPLGVRFGRYDDVAVEGPGETRACIGDCPESPALTADELRAYAAWLLARADELVSLQITEGMQ